MTKLLILALIVCYLPAAGQYNPKEYKIFDDLKTRVFHDDFDDNKNNWFTCYDSTGAEIRHGKKYIKDGVLYINAVCDIDISYATCPVATGVDFSRNFEIVFNAKMQRNKGGRYKHYSAIEWGRKRNGFDGYSILFNNWGNGIILYFSKQFDGGVHPDINKNIYSEVFNKDGFNRYTIRKFGDRYYFFVNGILEKQWQNVPLHGDLVSLSGMPDYLCEFQFISIFYLP